MGRVSLTCLGIAPDEGPRVAADVAEEFTHRPWQKVVSCQWDGIALNLVVESDHDMSGQSIADELSDAVAASWGGAYSIELMRA
jgi:hypothetical protein